MSELATSAPSEQGIDPGGIEALVDALERNPAVEPHGLLVARHGHLVAAGSWRPYDRLRPGLVYSLSKTFTSAALGLAVGEGLVDLDAPVLSYFPEVPAADVPARTRGRLVRHLAAMQAGHRGDVWNDAVAADPADPVKGFLRLAIEDEPGTTFAYSQPPVHTIATIVQRVSGRRLLDYLRERLLAPLGIADTGWQQYPAGQDLGFSGMFVSADAVVRLGLLLLADGRWDGRQLLPPGWPRLASTAHAETGREPFADWRRGYGFGLWRSRHGYRGDGAYGQYCLVLPDQDAVVVIMSSTTVMQAVLDAVWTHLVPAMTDHRRAASTADAKLARRLDALALEPLRGTAWAPDTSSWTPRAFTPLGGRCAELPSLTAVEVRPGTGLVLHEDDVETAGDDAIVVAAGWADDETLLVDAVFVQTPHRLWLVCDARSGTFTARWSTAPLEASCLAELRMPLPGDALRAVSLPWA